jgi:predicted DNA-binding mobile mystery protein A
MSTRQLGDRLGISQQSAAELEKAEQSGSITLRNLDRLAKALDADLFYAFVPRNSFEQTVRDQAERVAESVTARVETSMSLEDQSTASEAQRQRKTDLVDEYVRTAPRHLWDQN